jgi:hypothetical protein
LSKVEIVLNSAGIREMLQSAEMQALLGEKAAEIAGRCGEGYASDTYMTPGRVVSSVYTESKEAIKDNLDNNTILRNLS